jgi:hypothetical protein
VYCITYADVNNADAGELRINKPDTPLWDNIDGNLQPSAMAGAGNGGSVPVVT